MKKGVFGSALDKYKKKREIERLYDFAQHGVLNNPEFQRFNANDYITLTGIQWTGTGSSITAGPGSSIILPEQSQEKKKEEKDNQEKNITPKELYNLKVLNQVGFAIECSDKYIKENVDLLKKKLSMIRGNSGAAKYGKEELTSLIERLENRRNYKKLEKSINKYHHTTIEAVGSILNKEKHLRCKTADEFIPDFPQEAIEAMQEYEKLCFDLCKKKPVFYVIADKEDFGEINRKRDPILLAQSPFGFFWQILGAWDEEMVFLADL